MRRLFLFVAVSSIAAGGALAGPITVNLTTAGNNGASILNRNMASNGFIPCIAGTTTNGQTCTTSNTTVAALPSGPSTTFTNVLYNGVPVPFNIASGGANAGNGVGDTNDVWAPNNNAGAISKTIDVGTYTTNGSGVTTSGDASGIFGADQVWTMLNDFNGVVGYQGITLTLSGFQANGVTPITETIELTAGVDYRSIAGATVPGDPTACDVANIGTATLGASCAGRTSTTAQSSGTDSNYNATNVSEGVSITVYNSVFTTHDTLTTPNNYWLDVQDIDLGSAFLNGWLNTITVTSNDGTGQQEKAVLSAVTVDSLSTPEPGTVVLFGTGLAGLLFFQLKRTKKA
jgi:hypothetical protein